MPEKDIESRIQEFFGRTLRLNLLITADQDMLNRIMFAVSHQYDGKKFDESVIALGEGTSNKVYNIGSVTLPENQQELSIAIRLTQHSPLFLHVDYSRSQLEKELKEYEAAYALGENTPYFISAVTFMPYGESDPAYAACAILTEDISKKKTLTLKEIDRSRVERTNQNGSKELFFIDPHEFIELEESYKPETLEIAKRLCNGKKYLEPNARIDLHLPSL